MGVNIFISWSPEYAAMSVSVGVVGATTHKGRQLVRVLDAHSEFTVASLTTTGDEVGASYGSVADVGDGESLSASTLALQLSETLPEAISEGVSLLFSALPKGQAEAIEPTFAEAGFVVSSVSPNERLAPDVPLIVPELNPDHLSLLAHQREGRKWDGALVKAPSLGTAMLSIPLAALGVDDVTAVTVSALRSASGSHDEAVGSMTMLNNVVPHIPGASGRLETEPAKILGTVDGAELSPAALELSTSCSRVPTLGSSLLDVWVSTTEEQTAADVEAAFRDCAGSGLPSGPAQPLTVFLDPERPQPRLDTTLGGGAGIGIGGVEPTANGVQFHCVASDVGRGSVGTSVQNAELLVERGYVE